VVELRDVELFLVLAEELHFRRAAERLYLSPGRVSQSLRALEAEVGGPLFARNSRRVRLTALGERFRLRAQGGMTQLREALREAQGIARGIDGRLRVGYFVAVGGPTVAALASGFETRNPDCQVSIAAFSKRYAFGALRDGQIDILLAWCPGGNADAVAGEGRRAGTVLGTDARAVLVSTEHPLAAWPQASIETVADYELLTIETIGPREFVEGWAPTHTPAGKPLRRTTDELATMLGRDPIYLLDLQTTVAREHIGYLTIASILTHTPYPGLGTVPVPDLPPCVLTPIWYTDRETATIRAFTQHATEHSHNLWPQTPHTAKSTAAP
jgi:DNA-binding transcriptional LysR family regulator